jgi:DNA polymerase III delta subunit
MITLVTGENSFENERIVAEIIADFDGVPDKVDGETLELRQLPDLFMGATLFADKKLVIIKNLSENKTLWNTLADWLERIHDDVHVVLVESKPDKRTKTYKLLQKSAKIYESKMWTERDNGKAEQWASEEASRIGFLLDKKSAHTLVMRVGADQWQLHQALQKLALAGTVTPELIEETIDANPVENVFNLFEAALKKDGAKIRQMLEVLQASEDPYRVFGLLSTQAFQLAALALADKSAKEVASDLGAHPFALSKLAPFAKSFSTTDVKAVVVAFDEADAGMKTSVAEPWLLLERALFKVAST